VLRASFLYLEVAYDDVGTINPDFDLGHFHPSWIRHGEASLQPEGRQHGTSHKSLC
jgi:hypothetical protein